MKKLLLALFSILLSTPVTLAQEPDPSKYQEKCLRLLCGRQTPPEAGQLPAALTAIIANQREQIALLQAQNGLLQQLALGQGQTNAQIAQLPSRLPIDPNVLPQRPSRMPVDPNLVPQRPSRLPDDPNMIPDRPSRLPDDPDAIPRGSPTGVRSSPGRTFYRDVVYRVKD